MLSFRRHLMMDGNLRLHIPRMKSIMVVEGRRRLCRRGSSLTFSLSGHSVVNGIITPSHIKMNLSVFSFIFLVASKKTLKLLVVAKCSINQNIYKFSSFTQKPPRDSTYFLPSLSLTVSLVPENVACIYLVTQETWKHVIITHELS